MKRLFLLIFVFISYSCASQTSVPSAEEVLKNASAQAAKEKKKVFLLFHASWCGWCHKMDTAMSDPKVKNFFTDNYVICHLTVYESKGKEHLENPGALALLTSYKGNDEGIPYWMIFDKDKKLLADSRLPETKANTGCPASEKEVAHFIDVLKQTSALNDQQLEVIRKRFRENE